MKKLHIGCGHNLLLNWDNADFEPQHPGVLYIDATKRFLFPDNHYQFIFTEHMIEHIPFESGKNMLSECYRILSPGGRIRISTPNLEFLIRLYNPVKSETEKQYINWAGSVFTPWAPFPNEVFVINNFVRDWGHKFIYNADILRWTLTDAGFKNITRHNIFESNVEEFKNLENKNRMPPEFLQLETFTLEAVK